MGHFERRGWYLGGVVLERGGLTPPRNYECLTGGKFTPPTSIGLSVIYSYFSRNYKTLVNRLQHQILANLDDMCAFQYLQKKCKRYTIFTQDFFKNGYDILNF